MKNTVTRFRRGGMAFFCAIALAAAGGLAFVACDNGNTDTKKDSGGEPAYSGEFTMSGPVTGNDTVVFELDNTPARAAASSTSLSGKLKDKNGVYKRSATPMLQKAGAVKLSANSTNFRYIINGAFDNTGMLCEMPTEFIEKTFEAYSQNVLEVCGK